MVAVGVLIQGIRLSTRKYRRANVVAVMRNLLAKRRAGLPLLIFGRRVHALCLESGDFGDRKKFWCVFE